MTWCRACGIQLPLGRYKSYPLRLTTNTHRLIRQEECRATCGRTPDAGCSSGISRGRSASTEKSASYKPSWSTSSACPGPLRMYMKNGSDSQPGLLHRPANQYDQLCRFCTMITGSTTVAQPSRCKKGNCIIIRCCGALEITCGDHSKIPGNSQPICNNSHPFSHKQFKHAGFTQNNSNIQAKFIIQLL